jgi:hypothetical protein
LISSEIEWATAPHCFPHARRAAVVAGFLAGERTNFLDAIYCLPWLRGIAIAGKTCGGPLGTRV